MSSVFQYVFPASENYASIHSRLVMWLTWFIVYHSLFKRGRALNKEIKLHQYKWPVPVRWSAEIIYYFLTCCSIYTALGEKRNSAPQDIQLINKTTAEAVCSHITSKSRGLLRTFSQTLDFESEGFPQDQGNPQGSLGSTGGPQQLLRALWHPTAGSSPFHCTLPSHSWGITKAHRLASQQKELGGLEENIWTNDSGQVLCFCHFWSFFFSLNHFYSRKEKHALAHTAELSLPAALGRKSCWFSERRGWTWKGHRITSSGCCSGCFKESPCPRHRAVAQRYVLPARSRRLSPVQEWQNLLRAGFLHASWSAARRAFKKKTCWKCLMLPIYINMY